MSQEARDSGISVDNDNDSLSTTSSSTRDCNQLSYVQRLRKQFEILAKEQELEFHSECNWWLEDDSGGRIDVEIREIYEARKKIPDRTLSSQSEEKVYSKQPSINSQISQESVREIPKVPSYSSSPVKTPPTLRDIPVFTVNDTSAHDSDSFDSDSDGDEAQNEVKDDDLDEEFIRESSNNLSVGRPMSITSTTSIISNSKLFNIVRELIENEENYCKSLGSGINNYMSVFNRKEIPKTLRGQKLRIFANIESIHKFHHQEFLPSLIDCCEDPERIAECFRSFLSRDYFYGYIFYAINRKRSELLCNFHGVFWKKIQSECGDRLGINSFLLQPIQRLPRYQMLLNEIIKDLSKDLENTKQTIAACCVAEKQMQRLLDTVNESMSINDIRNCFEIDVLCQGKFKKMDEFDIYDWELRRRFRGKVFCFEKCVVYTEALDREYMEYRGHFESDKLGIIFKEGKSKFRLFLKKRGQKEVEFRANISTAAEWSDMITKILMAFVEEEKKRNASGVRKTSLIALRPLPDNVRGSIISTKSDQSNFSIGSYRSSSGNSSLGRDSFEPRASKWYI